MNTGIPVAYTWTITYTTDARTETIDAVNVVDGGTSTGWVRFTDQLDATVLHVRTSEICAIRRGPAITNDAAPGEG